MNSERAAHAARNAALKQPKGCNFMNEITLNFDDLDLREEAPGAGNKAEAATIVCTPNCPSYWTNCC